jgi:chloramphenicol-sensitive protein RarD
VVFVPAVVYLIWLGGRQDSTFTTEGASHAALLAMGGIVTAVPLMLFGAAAVRLPLTTVGLIQYLTPTMHFLIGVLVYGEAMPASRLAGFVLVWIALAVFTADAVGSARRRGQAAREADVGLPVAGAPARF